MQGLLDVSSLIIDVIVIFCRPDSAPKAMVLFTAMYESIVSAYSIPLSTSSSRPNVALNWCASTAATMVNIRIMDTTVPLTTSHLFLSFL